MAEKKTAAAAVQSEDQKKVDILTGILDKEARTYTMQRDVTVNGKTQQGTFMFRYPTVGDRLRQGVIQSKLLGGVPVASVDAMTYNVAFAMSFLTAITMQKPAWFTYEAMDDMDELDSMFAEVDAFVRSFRKPAE